MTLRRLHTLTLLTALAAGALFTTSAARPAELKVIAPNAVKEAVVEIGTRFSKDTNTKVTFTWTGSEAIAKRISEGELYDVVLTTSAGINQLAGAGKLLAQSTTDFSRSAVAAAARSGLPRSDISTVDGLKKALLDAKSIAISSGPSGRYLEALFEKLGVGAAIKPKIKQPPSGVQIGDMLAQGEADLGFQQVTELIHAKGLEYLGTLPPQVQNYTIWSAAIHAQAGDAKAAVEFVKALAAPAAIPELRKTGLEPVSK
jgi:molybdate transport system substrate-binding protein